MEPTNNIYKKFTVVRDAIRYLFSTIKRESHVSTEIHKLYIDLFADIQNIEIGTSSDAIISRITSNPNFTEEELEKVLNQLDLIYLSSAVNATKPSDNCVSHRKFMQYRQKIERTFNLYMIGTSNPEFVSSMHRHLLDYFDAIKELECSSSGIQPDAIIAPIASNPNFTEEELNQLEQLFQS